MNDTQAEFWVQAERIPTGCWEYRTRRGYSRPKSGYAKCWINGRGILAHRRAWEIANGPIPKGLWVLHKCDNPPCVNPEHLFLGTCDDNNKDMARKNRTSHGSRNGNSKLSEAIVLKIRRLRIAGTPAPRLAEMFKVHHSTVCKILRAAVWRRVPGKFERQPITACRNGHKYKPNNTYVNTLGKKVCRICLDAARVRYSNEANA